MTLPNINRELPQPIPWDSVEPGLGCTVRIYFDKVKLTLHNGTLRSQKPCKQKNKCDCSKTSWVINEVYVFFSIKYHFSDILLKNKHTLHLICWFNFSGNQEFDSNRAELTCYKVSKGAKIRNRYNQVPHVTQDTNGKVTNLQLDTTNESQEVSLFPAGDHKAHKKQTRTKT